jgi:hypothetical protein
LIGHAMFRFSGCRDRGAAGLRPRERGSGDRQNADITACQSREVKN